MLTSVLRQAMEGKSSVIRSLLVSRMCCCVHIVLSHYQTRTPTDSTLCIRNIVQHLSNIIRSLPLACACSFLSLSLSPNWVFSGSVHTTHNTCVIAFQFSHEGNGHANPTEPQQAPASPGGHCSGAARWDLGEGGDASTMLKVEKGMHKCSYLYIFIYIYFTCVFVCKVCVCLQARVCVRVYERERV